VSAGALQTSKGCNLINLFHGGNDRKLRSYDHIAYHGAQQALSTEQEKSPAMEAFVLLEVPLLPRPGVSGTA
jgi:phosphopantothenate synthetase